LNFGVIERVYSWTEESIDEDLKSFGLFTTYFMLFIVSKFYFLLII